MVYVNDRVMYLLKLSEFVRHCQSLLYGDPVNLPKLYLVSENLQYGHISYGAPQYYSVVVIVLCMYSVSARMAIS